MRRIIVAKNQARTWTLTVVAVTEPAGFLTHEDDSFADFQKGLIRELQPDTQVLSDRCQNLLLVPLGVNVGDRLNELADSSEILIDGSHPRAVTNFSSTSSFNCKYCW